MTHHQSMRDYKNLRQSEEIQALLPNDSLLDAPEDAWESAMRSFETNMASFEDTVKRLGDTDVIKPLKAKLSRLARKKAWKKRHLVSLRIKKHDQRKNRKRLLKGVDAWRIAMSQQGQAYKKLQDQEKKREKEEKKKREESKTKIKEMSRLLERLTLLRDLRRQRLENQGHFFPEEGNDFFNKVKAWHVATEEKDSTEQEEPSKETPLQIHPDDHWNDLELDTMAYSYWAQGLQNTETLRRIRKLWDHNIHEEETAREAKIPPYWVEPSPPANWVWASCLVQDS
ncbi:hypothetical protein CLU79DRAFT_717862 [Phycomyces nitens]|nr:hypothetical protein CLU79DRAFT_717862 [Phycomyces nitens]